MWFEDGYCDTGCNLRGCGSTDAANCSGATITTQATIAAGSVADETASYQYGRELSFMRANFSSYQIATISSLLLCSRTDCLLTLESFAYYLPHRVEYCQ